MLAQRFLVNGQRFAPTALGFEFGGALEHAVDGRRSVIARRRQNPDLSDGRSRQQNEPKRNDKQPTARRELSHGPFPYSALPSVPSVHPCRGRSPGDETSFPTESRRA